MGYLANMLIMLVCINFCMAVLGYTSAYDNILGGWVEEQAGGAGGTQVQLTGNFVGTGSVNGAYSIINTFILASIAALAVGGILAVFTGSFAIIYAYPVFVGTFLVDLILRATSFLEDPTIPSEVKGLLFSIIAVMAVVIMISFVRGSEP